LKQASQHVRVIAIGQYDRRSCPSGSGFNFSHSSQRVEVVVVTGREFQASRSFGLMAISCNKHSSNRCEKMLDERAVRQRVEFDEPLG
jgi:hypothetical protein